jgi:pyruvate dehydrogenase E1 component alpha subunit/2-oxoisovalerate dehydrogenase E1 component
LALADKLQGRRGITVCYFGDGAVAEGEFHESLNLAALWQLPVLFLCENNLYAMGTALSRHQAQTNIAAKAGSYSIVSSVVDGMDVLAVEAAAKKAADHVRSGKGPFLLEAQTYRFRAHSMADPDLYRSKQEVEEWKKRDPILLFQFRLRAWDLLKETDVAEIEKSIGAEIDAAVRFAEQSLPEPAEELLKDVSGTVQP